MIRIKFTPLLIARFSIFLKNSKINFRMFLYLVTCFLRVMISMLCRSQGQTISSPLLKLDTSFYDTACSRHSNETVTLRKYVYKNKNMRKWMIEFLRKFENRSVKINPINSIIITKSINLQLFTFILYGFGVSSDLMRLSVLCPFIEKSMVLPIQFSSRLSQIASIVLPVKL